jgi:hypothetical protein
MISLIEILSEIQISKPKSSQEIKELWTEIFGIIEDYWDDDNQHIMLGLDIELGEINEKYFKNKGIDIVDYMEVEYIDELNQLEKNKFYNDLLNFYNAKLK